MLIEEAQWVAHALKTHFIAADFPLLDVGSSTYVYRTITQPHIDEWVFSPLAAHSYQVFHTDLKAAAGVDIAGDFLDKKIQERLRTLGCKSILCASFLDDLPSPTLASQALLSLIAPGGKLIITVPRVCAPYPDPIDTLFRPDLRALHALFPNTHILEAATVTSSKTYFSHLLAEPKYALYTLLRLLLPFYKWKEWVRMLRFLPDWFTPYAVSCLVLQKEK